MWVFYESLHVFCEFMRVFACICMILHVSACICECFTSLCMCFTSPRVCACVLRVYASTRASTRASTMFHHPFPYALGRLPRITPSPTHSFKLLVGCRRLHRAPTIQRVFACVLRVFASTCEHMRVCVSTRAITRAITLFHNPFP